MASSRRHTHCALQASKGRTLALCSPNKLQSQAKRLFTKRVASIRRRKAYQRVGPSLGSKMMSCSDGFRLSCCESAVLQLLCTVATVGSAERTLKGCRLSRSSVVVCQLPIVSYELAPAPNSTLKTQGNKTELESCAPGNSSGQLGPAPQWALQTLFGIHLGMFPRRLFL